jgi:predicted transcriptional regulator
MKLEKFTQGFYGRIFNCKQSSISFSELRRKNVIIELGQLPSEVRMFFASVFLILWWDNLKLKEITPNVLVLDDFYRYANVEVIRKMLSEARKFKQGLICSHQGPYQLPQGIREEVVRNTSTKIIFKQEQTWDKRIVRDALGGLTKEHLILLSYLKVGQTIVKLPSIQNPERMDTLDPPENYVLLDHVIQNAMRKYMGEFEPYEEPEVEEPFEKKFLEEIHKNTQLPLTKIIKNFGIKTKRGYELKDRLVVEGYLLEEKIKKGIGRPRIFLKLTDEGLEFISKEGVKNPPQYGKDEHIYMINKIVPLLKDWNVKVEEGCDIKAEKNGHNVAIEIETRKANHKNQVLYNIKRDSAWADKIVLVCPNKTDKTDIEKIIQDKTDKAIVITYRQIDKIDQVLKNIIF